MIIENILGNNRARKLEESIRSLEEEQKDSDKF